MTKTYELKGEPYDDKTPLWFGKHRGKPLGEVPAEYLLWIRENFDPKQRNNAKLLAYIENNIEEIKQRNLEELEE